MEMAREKEGEGEGGDWFSSTCCLSEKESSFATTTEEKQSFGRDKF